MQVVVIPPNGRYDAANDMLPHLTAKEFLDLAITEVMECEAIHLFDCNIAEGLELIHDYFSDYGDSMYEVLRSWTGPNYRFSIEINGFHDRVYNSKHLKIPQRHKISTYSYLEDYPHTSIYLSTAKYGYGHNGYPSIDVEPLDMKPSDLPSVIRMIGPINTGPLGDSQRIKMTYVGLSENLQAYFRLTGWGQFKPSGEPNSEIYLAGEQLNDLDYFLDYR